MAVLQHELTLGEAADLLSRALPGHRVEIIQGRLIATPPPDGSHALSLSWLDEDFRDAHVTKNYYAPNVFRMVVEVTSSNWSDDLGPKVECYAQAGIPAYLVADRKHDEVLLYTDPADGKYPDPVRYKRGQTVPVPESVGVPLELSVDTLLDGDDWRSPNRPRWSTVPSARSPAHPT